MKALKAYSILMLLSCVNAFDLSAQETPPLRIAIMPLHANGIDSVYIQTSESILRTEIGKLSAMDIVSLRRTKDALGGAGCTESECALQAGRTLNASQVLGCQLSALGEKIIVQ